MAADDGDRRLVKLLPHPESLSQLGLGVRPHRGIRIRRDLGEGVVLQPGGGGDVSEAVAAASGRHEIQPEGPRRHEQEPESHHADDQGGRQPEECPAVAEVPPPRLAPGAQAEGEYGDRT